VEEVRALEAAVARDPHKSVLYSPLTRPRTPLTALITAPDPASVWRTAPIDVSPTRDDAPFFFYTLRLSGLWEARPANAEWWKTNLGAYMLFSLLVISVVMVTCFLLVPLAVARGRSVAGTSGGVAYLVYFGAIGFSFMLVEVAMIQRFMLFLGHPVYALVVVLFSLLAFCGIGSFLTRRFDDAALLRTLAVVVLAVVALVGVYIVALPLLFYRWVQLPQAARVAISVALLAPLATVMGMPMPMGLRLAKHRASEIVPWAWGVNGATSVLGSVSALVLALLTGFSRVLGVGAIVYAIALLAMRRAAAVTGSTTASEPAWGTTDATVSP
jgi:hypothetical protein